MKIEIKGFSDRPTPTDSDSYMVEITENGSSRIEEISANPEGCKSIECLELLAEARRAYERHSSTGVPVSNSLERYTSSILKAKVTAGKCLDAVVTMFVENAGDR